MMMRDHIHSILLLLHARFHENVPHIDHDINGKKRIYNLLKNTPNRDVVMTTHSPIIAKIASENELSYLESKNSFVSVIDEEKLDLIRKLASDEWNIMEAGVFLNSEKPLVLFEGKSDVFFVKRAIEYAEIYDIDV